jgi:hypothetical protein
MRRPVTRLQPARHVCWAVELDGVVVLNERNGRSLKLAYPQAAIWDFVTRGDSRKEIVCKIAAVASLAPEEAERLVVQTEAELRQSGFLAPGSLHG